MKIIQYLPNYCDSFKILLDYLLKRSVSKKNEQNGYITSLLCTLSTSLKTTKSTVARIPKNIDSTLPFFTHSEFPTQRITRFQVGTRHIATRLIAAIPGSRQGGASGPTLAGLTGLRGAELGLLLCSLSKHVSTELTAVELCPLPTPLTNQITTNNKPRAQTIRDQSPYVLLVVPGFT